MQVPSASDFDRMMALAEKAVEAVKKAHSEEHPALCNVCVNWADFYPESVQWILSRDGSSEWLVNAEEASPDNWQLGFWLHNWCKEHGEELWWQFEW